MVVRRKPPSGFHVWYDKVAAFNVEDLFSRPREQGPPRSVFVNQDLPSDYFDHKQRVKKEHVYTTNQVVTSKYTVITFLPRNLLEQFRRIANVFFAVIAILQFFSEFSTVSPGLVILPLIIVLAITGGKDGYEDIKRHQSDRHVNNSQVLRLNGGRWVNPNVMGPKERSFTQQFRNSRKSKHVDSEHSPDVEQALRNLPPETHDTPPAADATITTHGRHRNIEFDYGEDPASLDPESQPHWKRTVWEDLAVGDFVKIKDDAPIPADILICATSEPENVCYVETKNLDGETNLKSRNAVPALTHLSSALACADRTQTFRVDLDRPEADMYKLHGAVAIDDKDEREEKFPLDLQQVLLRGTVLKNTGWVIGVVLFTGLDTKIMLNSGDTPSKRSKVERQMNPQVFINLILLAAMGVACGIGNAVLEQKDYPRGAPWLFGDNKSNDNPHINGLITFIFALITFQNIIPISLYISIEAVRTCQAAFIYFDHQIYHAKTDTPTLARSWNLSDDLGQIEYIFSDKTGTLTQNAMIFRHSSIGGKVYRGGDVEDEPKEMDEADKKDNANDKPSTESAKVTARLSSASASDASTAAPKASADTTTDTAVPDPTQAEGTTLPGGVITHYSSPELEQDLHDAAHASLDGSESQRDLARRLNGFWRVLALCHTVLASVDTETGRISYKAQSPDEAALVQAAADVGFVFKGRDKEILRLTTPFSDGVEEYELLNVLDFTSARKRMSVIVRKLDKEGQIFLMSKGADSVIFERLKPGINEDLKQVTGNHLDEFASEGLRTLTLAYKIVPEDFYNEWADRYQEASVALEDRQEKLDVISDEIEQDLRLLGATAIEDRLQDGVPETIADLKKAGIKVWVATGDKLETAIAIGYSTNLIGSESNLIVVRAGRGEENTRSVWDQLYNAVEEFFPESDVLNDDQFQREFIEKKQEIGGAGESHALHRVNTGVSSLVGRNNGERPGGFVLVIDGAALGVALADDQSKELLLRLAILCEAVICCRVSPLQKSLIVKLVKDGLGVITLAIGDGANDVSMIQAADVGVGISGEEGLQAVNSSDYAIAQFRFLKRLLLVHGHWSYARNGSMILNFFYKNLVCIGILWWYMIYCFWSSQYVFEYSYLLFWNVFWTIAPPIAIGLFDRIMDADVLMAMPQLYKYGREGYWYGTTSFFLYMLDAVYQSAIIFFLLNYTYFVPSTRQDGLDTYIYEGSTTMIIVAVMASNAYWGLNTHAWTGWVFFSVSIGVILIWIYTAVYSALPPSLLAVPVYGNDHYLFRSAIFWFSIPITFCLSLAPRYIAKAYRTNVNPTDIDIMQFVRKYRKDMDAEQLAQEIERLGGLERLVSNRDQTSVESIRLPPHPESDRATSPQHSPHYQKKRFLPFRGSRTDMSTGLRSVHRGFDFATEEHGVAMQRIQSNLSERHVAGRSSLRHKLGHSKLFSLRRSRKRDPSSSSSAS